MILRPVTLPGPPLLVITDRRQADRPLDDLAEAVFAAGGRWLLLREKDLEPGARRTLLARLLEIGRPYDARVTVSADVQAALETGAAGVHLPAEGDVAGARAALGQGRTIGYSAHGPDEAAAAARAGADYVTLSPIFESESKPGYGPPLGLELLREAAGAVPLPVVALGGVTAGNAAACMDAGAAGIAVMGPVMRAKNPGKIVEQFLAEIAAKHPV
ncbi:MAG: thiamine phosphate synthase [Kiloniellales bacterium]